MPPSGPREHSDHVCAAPQPDPLPALGHQARNSLQLLDKSDFGELQIGSKSDLDEPDLRWSSNRVRLIARIIAHVIETFGQSALHQWLHSRFRRLADAAPLQKMRSYDGALEVEEYLTQIDEGMFV